MDGFACDVNGDGARLMLHLLALCDLYREAGHFGDWNKEQNLTIGINLA